MGNHALFTVSKTAIDKKYSKKKGLGEDYSLLGFGEDSFAGDTKDKEVGSQPFSVY